MTNSTFNPVLQLSKTLELPAKSIEAVLKLFSEGNTVPFIARYRKEATDNLDEVQIREIQEKHAYLVELEDRRQTVLASIDSQDKLTDELKKQILSCDSKTLLEDLYLPFKPKKRTRAMIAREKGLALLAERISLQPAEGDPCSEAQKFVDIEKGVETFEEALAGARDIVAEGLSENVELRSYVRSIFANEGVVISKVADGKDNQPTKYEQYYNFSEKVTTIPSHRYLAIRRGERDDILRFQIKIDQEAVKDELLKLAGWNQRSPFAEQLQKSLDDACKRMIFPSIETDLRVELKIKSDREAVDVFAANLRSLLLAAPLGTAVVLGIDPGIRTGCKCALLDATGKYIKSFTVFPFQGEQSLERAEKELTIVFSEFSIKAVAVGNGTAGRETELFVRTALKKSGISDVLVVPVNEAGASVYSASDIAREEFPDLDLTIRGAISIARRLQDPLAELVKIDPKSIGVGQYQHDVYQPLLQEKLTETVESCVNSVGVELNTASAPLLAHVSGIGQSLAVKIVNHREVNGLFCGRQQLLDVKGLGPRSFEQAAGFLRVRGGSHPLDASAVHPERYELVESIAKDLGVSLEALMANNSLVQNIDVQRYVTNGVGVLTLQDIVAELKKPGRDPRAAFEPPAFRDDVRTLKDLKPGMVLEGIVTNVAAFGAFIDIGVHQDGLIHVSELTDRYIKDPSEVVSVGQKLRVEVLTVDEERKRISLSARIGCQRADKEGGSQPSVQERAAKKQALPKARSAFQSNPFANL